MATDLDGYIFYDAGPGASVTEDASAGFSIGWRSAAVAWATNGVIRDNTGGNFAVGTTVGRAVAVNGGNCWIRGNYGTLSNPATVALATNTSGQTRIDRIVLRDDFVNNKIVLDVLQGTPGSGAPALTQNSAMWEISLAQITLATGYSSISSGNIFDERSFSQGRPAGGPDVVACSALRTTAHALSDGGLYMIDFDGAEQYDTASIHNPSSLPSRFTVRQGMAGLWVFDGNVVIASVGGDDYITELGLYVNGSLFATLMRIRTTDSNNPVVPCHRELALNAGDYVELGVTMYGASRNLQIAHASFRYIAPLPVV